MEREDMKNAVRDTEPEEEKYTNKYADTGLLYKPFRYKGNLKYIELEDFGAEIDS